jgi:hypothetical protein
MAQGELTRITAHDIPCLAAYSENQDQDHDIPIEFVSHDKREKEEEEHQERRERQLYLIGKGYRLW